MVANNQIAKIVKNNVPEITDLIQYWEMSEIFGMKALEVHYMYLNMYLYTVGKAN